MLEQIKHMWDDHRSLRSIKAVQHRVKLDKTDSRPIHSALYRAVPKATEFGKQEIHRMIAMDAIAPAHMELTSSIVVVPEQDELFSFVSVIGN